MRSLAPGLVGYLNGIMGGPGASYTFMAIALLASVVLMYNVRANDDRTAALMTTKKLAVNRIEAAVVRFSASI